MLELVNVSKRVGESFHIRHIDLRLEKGTLNVLLGPTLAGKTSLMRLMAGLDHPTEGDIRFNGESVLGVPVQKRNVAMVYQQFVNYPAMTVFDNIASPLRLAGLAKDKIEHRVQDVATLLKLTPFLSRFPLSLSGGQQQRTALARAIAKGAELVLLDEPLANLDYKLREELREELPKVFAKTGVIFVYATTEPQEALLLGGNTATLSQGRLTQFGPTIEVYKFPADLASAQTFSDPPLNIIQTRKSGGFFKLADSVDIPVPSAFSQVEDGTYTLAFRPHHLSLKPQGESGLLLRARVAVTEITGSESYIHLDYRGQRWIMLTHGIHNIDPDSTIDVHLDTDHIFVFDAAGKTMLAEGEALAKEASHGGN